MPRHLASAVEQVSFASPSAKFHEIDSIHSFFHDFSFFSHAISLLLSCRGSNEERPTMTSTIAIKAPRIAFLSGSTRIGSFSTKLISAAERITSNLGATTNIIDLSSYNLPLYNQDLEASAGGMPPAAVDLKSILAEQDAWVISTPEYNGFPTPLLVNTFTWLSRGDPDGQMYSTFANKSAVVLSASPGAMGGMRAINPTRALLTNLGVNVLAPSAAVGGAFKAFDEDGNLTDERQKQMVEAAMTTLFHTARDAANREAACQLIKDHLAGVGQYGEISVPT